MHHSYKNSNSYRAHFQFTAPSEHKDASSQANKIRSSSTPGGIEDVQVPAVQGNSIGVIAEFK